MLIHIMHFTCQFALPVIAKVTQSNTDMYTKEIS